MFTVAMYKFVSQSQLVRTSLLRQKLHNQSRISSLSAAYKSAPESKWNSKGTEREYRHWGDQQYQQCSMLRSLLTVSGIVGGAAIVVHCSPTVQNYIFENAPQLKPYVTRIDEELTNWGKKTVDCVTHAWSSLMGPRNGAKDVQQKPLTRSINAPSGEGDDRASFPSSSSVMQKIAQSGESIKAVQGNLEDAIKDTETAVSNALKDLRALRSATKRQLSERINEAGKLELSAFIGSKLEAIESRAKESHQNAQKQLAHLRAMLDSAKTNVSEKEKELVKSAIARYGDLAYELSGLVTEVRRLQTQNSAFVDLAKADNEEKAKLQEEINSILPKSPSGKPFLKEDGTLMSRAELESLLVMALERVERLQSRLAAEVGSGASESMQRNFAAALARLRADADRAACEAVERALIREATRRELERFEWEKQARANTEHELNAALARHGHHLAHMLRLKQEELEVAFDQRLREALLEQRAALEGELRRWIRRMEAVEHVVEGRADIDRVAKETQAIWLAVESLAFALEMPFSKVGASAAVTSVGSGAQKHYKPFYMSAPLGRYVDAVKGTAAGEAHEFARVVVDSLPGEALTDGVWTRQGLLKRFDKVYKTACNVALVDEAGGSLWSYAISWLQARLLFDGLGGRRRMLAHLPGVGNSILTPDSDLPDSADAFCLLTSARAALHSEELSGADSASADCSDIEFAVRLLGQLRGQPAAVAADWLRDARRFLEVHQAVQALLAYATAQNVSAFDERL